MNRTTQINAHPHRSQALVHRNPSRHKVLANGRRWGKTRLGVMECLDVASNGGRAWWVAPSYKMSEVGWRPLRRIGAQIPGAEPRQVDRQVILPSGGSVTVRSADDPDSLRGEGLDFVVLDECAFIQERAWTEALRPALSDRRGRAMFISTPKGRNWFWLLWLRGQSDDADWMSWQLPTSDNPYIPQSEIDQAERSLPERVFRQEYLAEFLDDAGALFRRVSEAATATEETRGADQEYMIGVDWAKRVDFTVFSVINATTKQQVYQDRFNQIDYQVQVSRLQALYEAYQPTMIVVEQNAMGEPLVEQLQRMDLPVTPFMTTRATKTRVIDALALAIEKGDLAILNDPVLVGELQAFEQETYRAPAGMHDDTVIALALAWYGVTGGWRPARKKVRSF